MFRKIMYRRLYEDVIDQIQEIISGGRLALGDRLPPERELADQVGVSRGTLREAFRILERQGIIETRPGGGRYIRQLPEGRLDRERILTNLETTAMLDLLEAREVIESKIVELACARATQSDIEMIERALTTAEDAHVESDEMLSHDQAFHLAIAEATHNIAFQNIVELNMALLFEMRLRTTTIPGRAQQILEEHRTIFEFIKSRDATKAKEALLKHLHNIKLYLNKTGDVNYQEDE